MTPFATTTAEALRAALASIITCSAQELQETIGQVVVATADELPQAAASGVDVRSVRDAGTRTLVLLSDRIPAGQEEQVLIAEIERHYGPDVSHAVIGGAAKSHTEVRVAQENPDFTAADVAAVSKLRSSLLSASAGDAPVGTKSPAVYLLAELSWGDDAYGEDLPVAVLYRVTEPTLQSLDKVMALINDGVLSNDGAYVAVPAEDAVWLSRVGFASDNTLASVPGFFDAQKDRVIYLCDVADMEIDGERADFASVCDVYEVSGGSNEFAGLRMQSPNDLGNAVSAAGAVSGWNAAGYMESWSKLREEIAAGLAHSLPLGAHLNGRDLRLSLDGARVELAGRDPATPEQAVVLGRLNAALDDAVYAALDAGCLRIQSELGVQSGDLAGMQFCTGSPAERQLRTALAGYLIDEVEMSRQMQIDAPEMPREDNSIAAFNARVHKVLCEAWPLVQKGTIDSVKMKIKPLVENPPGATRADAVNLLFGVQAAWPYVHTGPSEVATESRVALQKLCGEILQTGIPSEDRILLDRVGDGADGPGL